jgi:hypothetical protein
MNFKLEDCKLLTFTNITKVYINNLVIINLQLSKIEKNILIAYFYSIEEIKISNSDFFNISSFSNIRKSDVRILD